MNETNIGTRCVGDLVEQNQNLINMLQVELAYICGFLYATEDPPKVEPDPTATKSTPKCLIRVLEKQTCDLEAMAAVVGKIQSLLVPDTPNCGSR